MKKNFLLLLLLTLLPFAGRAQDMVQTEIGSYDELKAAFEDGGSYKLTEDILVPAQLVVPAGKAVTLDLNGKTISGFMMPGHQQVENQNDLAENTGIIRVQFGASLTVDDSSEDGDGVIDGTFTSGFTTGIMMGQKAINQEYNGDLTATLVVNGGRIKGSLYGISGNGYTTLAETATIWKGQADITINGGSVVANCDGEMYKGKVEYGTAIYQPGACNLLVDGDQTEIYGYGTAIEVRAGSATINGGYIRSSYNPTDVTPNGNGTTTLGAAFAIAQHTTKQPIEVTINGGEFKGFSALSVANPQENSANDFNVTLEVNGGVFDGAIIVADNVLDLEVFDTQFVKGGQFEGEDPTVFVDLENYLVLRDEWDWYAPNRRALTSEPDDATFTVIPRSALNNFSWTMQPIEGTYKATAWYPAITVSAVVDGVLTPLTASQYESYGITVKYFTGLKDGEVDPETEVEEMIHAGTYYVQVGILSGDEFIPFGAKYRTFTINQAPLSLQLSQISDGYYYHATSVKARYYVSGYKKISENTSDLDNEDNVKVINSELVDLTTHWWSTKDADGQIIPANWTALGKFDIVELQDYKFDTAKNYIEYTIDGSQAHAFVLDGDTVYEDYKIETVTSAQAMKRNNKSKIELNATEDNNQLSKIYGEKDPALPYVKVIDQDNLDMAAEDYSTEENPADITITTGRVKEGLYEDAGKYDVYVDITGDDAKYYTFTKADGSKFAAEDMEPIEGGTRYYFRESFTINQYDITEADVEDADKKVIITVEDVVYNGEYQQVKPSSVIFLDVEDVLAPVEGNPVTSNEYVEGTDEVDAHVILAENAGETGDWSLAYVDAETGKGTQKTKVSSAEAAAGHYTYWYNRQVSRLADGTVVEKKGEVQIEAVDASKNFEGFKFGNFTVQPRDLHILVNATTGFGSDPVYTLTEAETAATDDGFVVDEETGEKDKFTTSNVSLKVPTSVVVTPPADYEGNEGTYAVTAALKEGVDRTRVSLNYNPIFDGGTLNVTALEIEFVAADQAIDYNDVVNADGSYKLPDETTGTWTNLGDGKSVVLDVDVAGIVTTSMPLPTGYSISDFVELSCNVTAQGEHEGALVLTKKASAPGNITVKKVTSGNLTIDPLSEIHLAYDNVEQALEDHKGYGGSDAQPMKVYLPKRRLNADLWYGMVLPFEVYVPELSQKIGYASVALLNKEEVGSNVHFDTKVNKIPANEPFLLKVAPANQADYVVDANGVVTTKLATETADIYFDNVKIGETKYNGTAAEDPYVQTAGGTKFIGSYKTIEYYEPAKYYVAKNSFAANEAFLSYANGKFYKADTEANKAHKMLTTDAYLSFASADDAAGARIFIDEEDGTSTAIDAIGVEPVEAAPTKLAEGWYTVNGVKLNAKPTQKGAYIFNGKKVYVK